MEMKFEDIEVCEPEFEYTEEWLRKNTRLAGWLGLFQFSLITGGIYSIFTAIYSFFTYGLDNAFISLLNSLGLGGMAFYTVFLFLHRKPSALFFAKGYLLIIFLWNLLTILFDDYDSGSFGSWFLIARITIFCVLWFLYLTYSKRVKRAIPKVYRKVKLSDFCIMAAFTFIPMLTVVLAILNFC